MADETEQRLRSILRVVLKVDVPESGDVLRADTVEWDSLKHIELIFATEDEFSVSFDETEMAEIDQLSKIVELVRSKQCATL